MAGFPAFLFYPEDFAAGTADMAPDAIGIYVRCLCHQWAKGFVPSDRAKVARITGATSEEIERVWPEVCAKFVESEPGKLINERMEVERQKLLANQERRAAAGKVGAAARWSHEKSEQKKNGKRNAIASKSQCDSDGKTMASRVVNGNKNESLDSFERFWSAFPSGRKRDKGSARKAWTSATSKCDPDVIIAAAAEYAQSDQGRGEFVKMPSSWLNGECWSDDREAWKSRGSPAKANGKPAFNPHAFHNPQLETKDEI